jgi:hypothetical protein
MGMGDGRQAHSSSFGATSSGRTAGERGGTWQAVSRACERAH